VDDGVLLLVAKDDRTVRIEVGYELEGALNDATAKRIVEEFILPKFKQGNFYGGLTAGLERIVGVIDGEPLPPPKSGRRSAGQLDQYFPLLFFVALAVGGILRAVFGDFLGGVLNGGLIGVIVWFLGAGLVFAAILGFVAFIATLSGVSGMIGRGGFGRGGGGGGFSGGGGGFGGGGASGRW